jgi:hypothetical protein
MGDYGRISCLWVDLRVELCLASRQTSGKAL